MVRLLQKVALEPREHVFHFHDETYRRILIQTIFLEVHKCLVEFRTILSIAEEAR